MKIFTIILVLIFGQVALSADTQIEECAQDLKWNKMRKQDNVKFCQEFTPEHRSCAKELMNLKDNKLDYKKNIVICRTYSSNQIQCAKDRVNKGLGSFVNQFSYCLQSNPTASPTPSGSPPSAKPAPNLGSGVQ